jgi:hypothetical protein
MMGDHQHFARLSDEDLTDIARAMRFQPHGNASLIANALDRIVQRRCEVQEARRQRNPARVGLRVLRRLTCWASVRASVRIDAALGRSRS